MCPVENKMLHRIGYEFIPVPKEMRTDVSESYWVGSWCFKSDWKPEKKVTEKERSDKMICLGLALPELKIALETCLRDDETSRNVSDESMDGSLDESWENAQDWMSEMGVLSDKYKQKFECVLNENPALVQKLYGVPIEWVVRRLWTTPPLPSWDSVNSMKVLLSQIRRSGVPPVKSSFTTRMPQSLSCNDRIAVAVSPLVQSDPAKRRSDNLTMKEFARLKRMIATGDTMRAKDEVELILASDSCTVRDRKLCAILFGRMSDYDRFGELKDGIDALNPSSLDGDCYLDKLLEAYDFLQAASEASRTPGCGLAAPMMEYVIMAILVAIFVAVGIWCAWHFNLFNLIMSVRQQWGGGLNIGWLVFFTGLLMMYVYFRRKH